MRTSFISYTRAASILASILLSANAASADDVRGLRSDKLVEKTHVVDLRIGHGHADLVVRRTVHNGGPRHDQATFYIDMPSGAVAVGLRTLGTLDGKPHWFDGELLEAEKAAARYRELTGVGGYYPKDPALLSWRSQNLLALQVFPCPPGEDKTIEYTLRLPTQYRDGRHHLDLTAALGTEELPAAATVSPMIAGEALFVGDTRQKAPAQISLKEAVDLSVAPASEKPVEGALASVGFGKQKNVVHFHVAAAPALSRVPRGAHVVVLIDASRSLDQEQVEAEVAMTRAYLSHFPDARAAVFTFDRAVHASKKGFVSVREALAGLDGSQIVLRNGSHIDEALSRADALLAALPENTPKRILALTDTRTRQELTPERLRGQLSKSGALLHVGVVDSAFSTTLTRDDTHAWAAMTRPTGGLVWQASMDTADQSDEPRKVYEELARPKRIDHFQVHAQGIAQEALVAPEALAEGESFEDLRLSDKQVPFVEVTGELWATPVRRVLVADEAENRRWAGLVFGSNLLHSIEEADMMSLAVMGRAVSPVTSYLAIEPGVRPSTEGIEEFSASGWGFGSSNCRLYGSHRAKPPQISMFDKQAFLKDELSRGLAACGGAGKKATVGLESTLEEIVSVRATIDGEKAGAKLVTCLEEAAWGIELPGAFASVWQGFTVVL
ncbi:vWA domain-containing protein [Polyangium jinanense]|uniref:VWA domain-containing protein n=1 Tax=Polyangium jinanense TaxID=2829994 RepID=A0A9X3X652_9BACT|nr:vWA domain-containing protein [Polyangium jinanense]MDC3956127.1 VWA domain-containing protein [Polyangium jinanense]MDC3983038.1 VWA domain-containing protein [Polyangium jinanense]